MTRRLLLFADTLSLALSVLTIGLWVCSYHGYSGLSIVDDTHPEDACWRDWFVYRGKLGTVFARYDAGMSSLDPFDTKGKHRRWTPLRSPPVIVSAAVADAEAGRSDWGFAEFGTYASIYTGYSWTVIPLWMIAVLFAVLPSLGIAVHLRSKPAGRCRNCGYDLRVTPDRCPECGTVP